MAFKRQRSVRGIAREILRFYGNNPQRWMKASWYDDFKEPTRCCLDGGACLATGYDFYNDDDCTEVPPTLKAFRKRVGQLTTGPFVNDDPHKVYNFNDHHTFEEVCELLRAIRDGREAQYQARHPRARS